MKVLATRFWNEPALALGLIASIVVALGELLIGDGLQATDLPAIAAPLIASGITRPLVTPSR